MSKQRGVPSSRWTRPKGRPLVIGHRGAKALVIENTMMSFERAIKDGADGIELDVRLTADGTVVVVHDTDLARITNGRDGRSIAQMPASEVVRVILTDGGTVPTLAEVLDWAESVDVLVNVELKHDVVERYALARAVTTLLRDRAVVAPQIILSSFQPQLLAWSSLLMPAIPRALLVNAKQRLAHSLPSIAVSRVLGGWAIHPERTLCTRERVERWTRAGFALNVWTVNDTREAVDLARLGVNGIITDDPGRVISALSSQPA